jgi:DNA repair exonuclease SbcCD ATPase subunit
VKIIKLIAENVKKLKAVAINLADQSVIKITGANEQGKTTILDCIWWALGGTKDIQEKPIREGQDKAKITLDLGDLIVTRKFLASGTTVEVANKEGAVFKSPQAIIDALVGRLSFDPLKFAKSKPEDQMNTLLSVTQMKVDNAKLCQITGETLQEVDNPISAINGAYKAVEEKRRDVNRDLKNIESQLLPLAEVVETKPVDIVELVAEKERIANVNSDNNKERELITLYTGYVKTSEEQIKSSIDEIMMLEKKMIDAKNRLESFKKVRDKNQSELDAQAKKVSGLVDLDLSEVTGKIQAADQINRIAQNWERKVQLQNQEKQLAVKSDHFTSVLEQVKKYKEDLVSSVKFPIKGLGFSSAGVTLDGLPFDQASSAAKLRASVAIAMALNPKLRVIRIDDGSLLDSKSMAIIEEMAKDNDYQVWIEAVDESGKVGLFIEDGQIVSNNYSL